VVARYAIAQCARMGKLRGTVKARTYTWLLCVGQAREGVTRWPERCITDGNQGRAAPTATGSPTGA
jgi:hypothetical protein